MLRQKHTSIFHCRHQMHEWEKASYELEIVEEQG